MKRLIKSQIETAEEYINTYCRPLEQKRFSCLFRNGDTGDVYRELEKFQNADGGFGNGLEPDFLLPDSSALATSLAFQFLDEIPDNNNDIVKQAIGYLEQSYLPNRKGWLAVPKEVNNYPHAEWWNWDFARQQTVIDQNWGNPTAEIIGYLYKHRNYLNELDIDQLTNNVIQYWNNKESFKSEHEVYCFIRLHKYLAPELAKRLEDQLILATKNLVSFDPDSWNRYTPQPLHFVDSPAHFLFNVVESGINDNLDYLVKSVDENGVWSPNWTWKQYEDEWKKTRTKWQGLITINNIKTLNSFGRTEN